MVATWDQFAAAGIANPNYYNSEDPYGTGYGSTSGFYDPHNSTPIAGSSIMGYNPNMPGEQTVPENRAPANRNGPQYAYGGAVTTVYGNPNGDQGIARTITADQANVRGPITFASMATEGYGTVGGDYQGPFMGSGQYATAPQYSTPTPTQQAKNINDFFQGRDASGANPGNSNQAFNNQGGSTFHIDNTNAVTPNALDTPMPYNPQSSQGITTYPGGFNGPYYMYQSDMGGGTQVRSSTGVNVPGNPVLAYPYDLNQNSALAAQYTAGQISASQFFAMGTASNVERDAGLLGGVFETGTNPFQTSDLNANVFSNLFRTNSAQGVSGTVGALAGASF